MTSKTKFIIAGIVIFLLIVVLAFALKLVSKGGIGTPPARFSKETPRATETQCPEPLLTTPIDLTLATAVLYPGQERGGDFKPHGGFRFDNATSNAIEVRAAMDGILDDASRYIEKSEVQYLFDFQSDCGYRYRFDHLLTLAPKFAAIADELPNPKEHDSRTTKIPPVKVTAGELIATAIGFEKTNNVFMDFGLYDLRGKGRTNPRPYAVCWFDLLPAADAERVKLLPSGDSAQGTTSTLCK